MVAARVSCKVVEKKATAQLGQTNMLVVDVILHACAKLIEEFKSNQQADGDPDYDNRVWRERELELARGEVEVEVVPLWVKELQQATGEGKTSTVIKSCEEEHSQGEQKEGKEPTRNLQAELEHAGSNT